VWRYSSLLPQLPVLVSKGEGLTPITRIEGVLVKNERLNPTGSYADRASAVISSYVKSRGLRALRVVYEPGFARSISYYLGDHVKATYCLEDAVSVDVEELFDVAERGELSTCGSGEGEVVDYASALVVEGLKTIVFEIVERGLSVDYIVAPAKTGVLAYSLAKGLGELEESGLDVSIEVIAVHLKKSPPPLSLRYRRVRFIGVSQDEFLESFRLLVKKGVYTAPLSAMGFHVARSLERAVAVLTVGYRTRPKRRRRWLTEKIIRALEELGKATAYEVWRNIPEASLRGVYKAIKSLVAEGVVCEEPSTRGRRKIMLYKLCS